ncbi:DUF2062 domain-containing protein [Hydrogenophaga sp. UC242_53]|uniref:DUF2062 domain-containing protein n=1 Tax=Hydrogenophaga sp. UC242_53 TaxID=3350170 RepID=UPI0036D31BBD
MRRVPKPWEKRMSCNCIMVRELSPLARLRPRHTRMAGRPPWAPSLLRMKQRIKTWLSTQDGLRHHRWLRWMGPVLHQPRLWHFSRKGIAMGVAVGIFFGLLVPIAQMPLSAAAAVLLRANLPMAVAQHLRDESGDLRAGLLRRLPPRQGGVGRTSRDGERGDGRA